MVLVDVIADRRPRFDRGEKGAMRRRHVVTHVEEVRAQRIIAVPYTQCRVECGDNRALSAGLACELLRSPCEDALVDQPVGQGRIPAMNVGAHLPVIHMRVTVFRHSHKRLVHALQRACRKGFTSSVRQVDSDRKQVRAHGADGETVAGGSLSKRLAEKCERRALCYLTGSSATSISPAFAAACSW